jgi:uncharacterized protein YndB with AHSA1/START domain
MRMQASRELLASREDVWRFLAEPYHLADWWPGASGVQPDRRGSAVGARWEVTGGREPTLFRRPGAATTLVVTAAERPRLFAFHVAQDRLDVRVELEWEAPDRTRALVTVQGPWLIAFRRSLARRAASRLYALCQTAASFGE